METIKREGFMAFLLQNWQIISFFIFGIIYRSAFLFLTCKGSLLLLMRKAVLRTGWLKKSSSLRCGIFFAKPCTIRAKDKCLTCKR